MGAKQKISAASNRVADGLAERNREFYIAHRRHMSAAHRIGAGGIKFYRRIAAIDQINRAFCGQFWRSPKVIQIMVRKRIKVTIGADTLVHDAAQQSPDRPLAVFAQNIPAGNFKSRKGAHHR